MSDRQGASQSEQVPASPAEGEPPSQPDALIHFQMSPHGLGLMGQRQQVRDHMDLIKTAVDASPTKVAVVGVRKRGREQRRAEQGACRASRRPRALINTLSAQRGSTGTSEVVAERL